MGGGVCVIEGFIERVAPCMMVTRVDVALFHSSMRVFPPVFVLVIVVVVVVVVVDVDIVVVCPYT